MKKLNLTLGGAAMLTKEQMKMIKGGEGCGVQSATLSCGSDPSCSDNIVTIQGFGVDCDSDQNLSTCENFGGWPCDCQCG